MDGPRYSIGELAELTGVSRRTVHFYVQRRLIDPPLGRGRGRHYDERHARQILEVRAMQGMGVPLAEMRRAAVRSGDAEASRAGSVVVPQRPSASPAPVAPAAARPAAPAVPSVTPSIMSVVRVRVAENVTVELSPGAPALTPALVADLAAAVAGVFAGQTAREGGRETGGPDDGAGAPPRGPSVGGTRTLAEEDPEEES